MDMNIRAGSTDVTTNVQLFDDTTGAPKIDLTITNIDMIYIRERSDVVKVDATALTNDDDDHTDNKAKEIVDGVDYEIGVYRFDWPDAAFATGADFVTLVIKCTGVRTKAITVGLTMVGTDSAALASVCTEARLAELAAANLPSDVDDIKSKTDHLGSSIYAG